MKESSLKFYLNIIVVLTFSTGNSQINANKQADELREILKVFFVPVETNAEFLESQAAKIKLGRHLFYDNRLSGDRKVSCNSCHDLSKYGTNGSYYLNKLQLGDFYRDVPSLYNVSTLPMFNADGGVSNLKEKLKDVFSNAFEMQVQDETVIVEQLKQVEAYNKLFKDAFSDEDEPLSFNNIIEALQVFIQGLVTPSPIDDFIKGNNKALSKEQIEGGHVFNNKSCYSCHTGSNVGGQMIQKLGIEVEWPNKKDLGYYQVKRLSDYKMFFRVAPLRNVSETAPYFHDASSNRLWQAVKLMGKHERGLELSTSEALKIEVFLKALSGKISSEYIKKPNKLIN